MTRLPPSLLLCLLLTGPVMAADNGYQNLSDIRQTASQYVANLHSKRAHPPHIAAGELDPRLHLAACTTRLVAFLPAGARAQGNTTVGVRCNGRSPWQVYVPVVVKIFDQVLVAAHPLARGTPLTRDDVRLVERDLTTLPFGYMLDPAKVVGNQLKQPVAAGSVLLPSQIEGARLIHRGESVVIIGSSPGLAVRMQGLALGDGAAGDWIKVRNTLTKKEISGQVTTEGEVQVKL